MNCRLPKRWKLWAGLAIAPATISSTSGFTVHANLHEASGRSLAEPITQQSASSIAVRSLAVSRDGKFVAFARSYYSSSPKRPLQFEVLERQTNEVHVVSSARTLTRLINPAWSPDGRYLAYYGGDAETWRLHIWDRVQKREIFESDQNACLNPLCNAWAPQWQDDSQTVIFVADPLRQIVGSAAEDIDPRKKLMDELYGITESQIGVTVLHADPTNPVAAQSARSSDEPTTQIIAIDLATRKATILASGAAFVGVRAGVGSFPWIAVAQVSSAQSRGGRHFSYYALPPMSDAASDPKRGSRTSATALRLIASEVPNWQAGASLSVSPSGRFVAYVTTGPDATGDVYLIDLLSGAARNLTERVQLSVNEFDVGSTDVQRRSDWHGKFGSANIPPIWSSDDSSVYVVRPIPLASSAASGARVSLWQVTLDGDVKPVATSETNSIIGFANCEGGVPCATGRDDSVMATVRNLATDGDTLSVVRIDAATGTLRHIHDFGPIASDFMQNRYDRLHTPLAFAVEAGVAIGEFQTPEVPPELWSVDVFANRATSLRLLNPNATTSEISVRRVHWKARDGESLEGALYLPTGRRHPTPMPVVMAVYAGGKVSQTGDLYQGGMEWYHRLLDDGRYALLVPDLPQPKMRNGPNCDGIADNAVKALDAASATGLIDSSRAALIGHSWGGYTVNCIITRTDRFRAAISVAGMSNLVSAGRRWRALTSSANIDSAPWSRPDVFVRESPVFHADRIRTPLMLVYGKRDTLPVGQIIEMYDAIQALTISPVQLVGYDKSGHLDMLEYPDFWDRVHQWLGRYLHIE